MSTTRPQRDVEHAPARDGDDAPERNAQGALGAERSLLAAMLLDGAAIGKACDMLQPQDFYAVPNAKMFAALLGIHERGEPADLITLGDELRRCGDLDVIGGLPYLAKILDMATTSANVEAHAAIVRE